MIDNKKVIDGQKEVIMHLLRMSEICSEDDEPYYNKLRNYAINTWALLENLLKEQEPMLLENQHKPFGYNTNANSPWISRCPKCKKKIEGKQTHYCKYCGQAVKWYGTD